jgi:DNA-binding XRE family transcriptional regulator
MLIEPESRARHTRNWEEIRTVILDRAGYPSKASLGRHAQANLGPMGNSYSTSLYFLDMMLYFCNTMYRMVNKRTKKDPTEPVLHNRLTVLRAEHHLSRQDLADAVGVNYQTIGYLERGDYNPSLDLAFRLSEHFNVPIEAIFSRHPFQPLSQTLYASTK